MPLTRGTDVGYNLETMTYTFTMYDDTVLVRCTISSAALVELSGDRWKRPPSERGKQFEEYRDQIEGLASSIFDATPSTDRGTIRIFAKHLSKASVVA